MAYSELIKNLDSVRSYMRQFYVYGFRSRSEYTAKSARSYDNERRRIESWLGDSMAFRQNAAGKNVFISVDSRSIRENPLYAAFRAKSFTPGDITFHFYVMDLLSDGGAFTVKEIMEALDERLADLDAPSCPDESSVRKKLKEYEELGLLHCEKRGRELLYSRSDDAVDLSGWAEALAFYSENDPLGVIGAYLQSRLPERSEAFGFKHHYILHAPDSDVVCVLLSAMEEHRAAELTVFSRRRGGERKHTVFPAKLYISTQSGRQYLLCYHYIYRKPMFFRVDSILHVKPGAEERQREKYAGYCEKFRENLWGVSSGMQEPTLDHVEMTVRVEDGEGYILDRLEREKRGGRIEALDDHTYRFVTDVYDAAELLPWVRTFIGRITAFESSNRAAQDGFWNDLDEMTRIYTEEGGDGDAVS